MNLYKSIVRPLLFNFDPEWTHNQALHRLAWAGDRPKIRAWMQKKFSFEDNRLSQEFFGLQFSNPIGLAAGFDKNGLGTEAMQHLGFGSLEIGSVSNGASKGNPLRPRLFRIPRDGVKNLAEAIGTENTGGD